MMKANYNGRYGCNAPKNHQPHTKKGTIGDMQLIQSLALLQTINHMGAVRRLKVPELTVSQSNTEG